MRWWRSASFFYQWCRGPCFSIALCAFGRHRSLLWGRTPLHHSGVGMVMDSEGRFRASLNIVLSETSRAIICFSFLMLRKRGIMVGDCPQTSHRGMVQFQSYAGYSWEVHLAHVCWFGSSASRDRIVNICRIRVDSVCMFQVSSLCSLPPYIP